MVQHGILLDLLNLRTHLPGIIPHTNQTGRQTMTTTRDARSQIKTSTWQDWDTWANGEMAGSQTGSTQIWCTSFSSTTISVQTSHSLPHIMAPQANARNLPNRCGNIHSLIRHITPRRERQFRKATSKCHWKMTLRGIGSIKCGLPWIPNSEWGLHVNLQMPRNLNHASRFMTPNFRPSKSPSGNWAVLFQKT